MADIGTTLKDAFAKSMEAIGSAANSIATNTRFRVDEMNLTSKRNELLNAFGAKAYEVWKTGATLPESLDVLMREVADIDAQLEQMRQEHAPKEEPAAEAAPVIEKGEATAPSLVGEVELAVSAVTDDAIPTLEMPDTVTEVEVELAAEDAPETDPAE